MKMKQLFRRVIVFLITVWTRLHFSIADTDISAVWSECGNIEYRNGSDFQLNLNQVLNSLVESVSAIGFNTSIAGDGKNSNGTVYGLLQCRGDLNSTDCEQCAATMQKMLLERCPNTSSGFIELNQCFLRYENHNFFNDYNEGNDFDRICNGNVGDQKEKLAKDIQDVLSNITEIAVQNPKLFATLEVESIYSVSRQLYSLAQCWRDLSHTKCRSCLAAGLLNISACATGAIGARYWSRNCELRYELYNFFNNSTKQSVSVRKKSNLLGIPLAIIAATVGLLATIALWKWLFFSRGKSWEWISRTSGQEGEINLSPGIVNPELIFKYAILREATSDFKGGNKLGQGGFGSVFKGVLPDGRDIAVKRLNIGSRQGDTEFLNEANLISCVQHRNLVKLIGCSIESSERLLVYEYLERGSLDKILFDTKIRSHLLEWKERYEIIVGTARGLAYLHEESEIRIIHRDIKASNILLDNKYRPKIADFGLAKLFAEDESHLSTKVAGTLGYMAPEYALRGQLTEKADVFSFGVLVLEIISGRKNQSLTEHSTEFLLETTWRLYNEEKALEVIEPTLEGSYSWEEGIRVIKIGLLCTQAGAALRPSMSRVVSMLTSEQEHLPPPTRPAFLDLESVGTPEQFKSPTVVDPDQTTSSSVATSSTIPNYDIYPGSADTTVILDQTRGENEALSLCPFIKRWRYPLSLLHYVRYYVYH